MSDFNMSFSELPGNIPNRGAINGYINTLSEGYSIPKGYHNGAGTVNISAEEAAKLIPENIKKGVEILGVEGSNEGSNSLLISMIEGTIINVVIPTGTTKLRDHAFYGYQFGTITLPDTLIEIGNDVFAASTLKSIVIPNSVTKFGYDIFQRSQIESVVFPQNCTKIPEGCFKYCNFEEYVVPSQIKKIGAAAFLNCQNLRTITLPEGLEEIEGESFQNTTALEEIIFPSTLKDLSTVVFTKSGITVARFLGKPDTIHNAAFYNARYLTDIYVPWQEGEVSDAPWGATNATIHYNYIGE